MMDRIERIKQSFDIRQIHQNDTHDYIQRHDPDHFKNKEKHTQDWSDHDEDLTDISVESLIIFLEGLKKNQPPPQQNKDQKINLTMKKAIEAYGEASSEPKKRYTYLDEGNQDIDFDLVDYLIDELQTILNDNIAHITLLPADGFLKSIEMTVEKINAV